MKIQPVGDVFQIEVGATASGMNIIGGLNVEEGVRKGKIVAIGDDWQFFGYVTYMFDNSLDNLEMLNKLRNHYKKYVGKTVYWPSRTEAGTDIDYDGKTYVFVKCAGIMAVEDK